MAWLYVPELEGLSEELNRSFQAQEPFAMSKGKPIPLRSWPLRWKRDAFLKHLYGLTCEPSMAKRGVERFLSSLEDSPVNLIRKQGNNSQTKTLEICGPNSRGSLAKFDHSSSSWRTCQMSLSGHYPQFSKTFPKWGMMRRGVLWRLPKLERHTKDHVGFSLPTPTTQANMLCDSMKHSQAHRNLKEIIFPTPTASDGMRSNLTYGAGNLTLKGAVIKQNWPTPTVNHIRNHNEPLKNYDKRVQDWKEGKTKGKPGISLGVAVRKYPTPNASEGDKITGLENQMSLTKMGREGTLGNGGKLNPEWVEWLMGWPIGFTECAHVVTE